MRQLKVRQGILPADFLSKRYMAIVLYESNNKHRVLFACPKSTKRTKRGRCSSFELLPHIKGVAGVHEVCTLTEEKACSLTHRHGTEQSRADNPCIGACTSAFARGRTVHSICSHRRVYIVRALAGWEVTGRFLRGNLLDDFWYFWSCKST